MQSTLFFYGRIHQHNANFIFGIMFLYSDHQIDPCVNALFIYLNFIVISNVCLFEKERENKKNLILLIHLDQLY